MNGQGGQHNQDKTGEFPLIERVAADMPVERVIDRMNCPSDDEADEGEVLASTSLAASATVAAALTSERGRDEDQAKSLHRFLLSAGGPVHGGGLASLLGALGLACLRTGALAARWQSLPWPPPQ